MPKIQKLARTQNIAPERLVEDALAQSGGNIAAAARQLGITRFTLYSYLRKHNFVIERRAHLVKDHDVLP